jgi:hypothetical protein
MPNYTFKRTRQTAARRLRELKSNLVYDPRPA